MGVLCQLLMSTGHLEHPSWDAEENKILQHWDLFSCGAPKWSTTCNSTKNSFDVIMIRDAFQHIAISKAGLKTQQPQKGLFEQRLSPKREG